MINKILKARFEELKLKYIHTKEEVRSLKTENQMLKRKIEKLKGGQND